MSDMSYYDNIYETPEKFGLVRVGEADFGPGGYEWDLVVVWQKGDEFYYGADSGCSCSSPFEQEKGVEDLAKINRFQDLVDYLNAYKKDARDYDRARFEAEAADLIQSYLTAKKG